MSKELRSFTSPQVFLDQVNNLARPNTVTQPTVESDYSSHVYTSDFNRFNAADSIPILTSETSSPELFLCNRRGPSSGTSPPTFLEPLLFLFGIPWIATFHGTVTHLCTKPGTRPPLRDPILSFWHTNFTKRSRLGSPRPPYEVHAPPTGNPGSATTWSL